MKLTVTVKIETGDKYNSSTYSEITLDLNNPLEVAIANSFVSQQIINSLKEEEVIEECCLAG